MTRASLQTLSRYTRWMNERLYALCAELPDAERKADRGAFFHSIHGTLNHLLLADRVWLGRFLARPFSVTGLDQELYAGFEDLRRERARTDDEIDRWVESLDDASLDAPLRFRSIVGDRELAFPLGFVALHFFNHQTHHRGQLTTLLQQAGRDPGITDLLWLPPAAPPAE